MQTIGSEYWEGLLQTPSLWLFKIPRLRFIYWLWESEYWALQKLNPSQPITLQWRFEYWAIQWGSEYWATVIWMVSSPTKIHSGDLNAGFQFICMTGIQMVLLKSTLLINVTNISLKTKSKTKTNLKHLFLLWGSEYGLGIEWHFMSGTGRPPPEQKYFFLNISNICYSSMTYNL